MCVVSIESPIIRHGSSVCKHMLLVLLGLWFFFMHDVVKSLLINSP